MATEIITSYPLPPYRDDREQVWGNQDIIKRLGAIEERLSRIEKQLTEQQPHE